MGFLDNFLDFDKPWDEFLDDLILVAAIEDDEDDDDD